MSVEETVASIVHEAANDFEAKDGYFILEKEAATELVGADDHIVISNAFAGRANDLGKAVNFGLEEVVVNDVVCYKLSWSVLDIKLA